MGALLEIVSVDATNLDQRGFFCRKSKMKTAGNQAKLAWVRQGFSDGLGLEVVYEEGRSVGFVEYVSGRHAWRAVHADDYLFIHCIWVVGRAKRSGHGSALLEKVEAKARVSGAPGVAMVTSSGVWLAGSKLLAAYGYNQVDEAPPSFQLMAKTFNGASPPFFPTNWSERAAAFGDGLTVVTTDQCPYSDDAVGAIVSGAGKLGLPVAVERFESAADLQRRSPSAFGVFGVVFDGELLSYHYLLEKDLVALVR